MAAINSVRRLVNAHRRAQAILAARGASDVLASWQRRAQPARLPDTVPAWLDEALGAIRPYREQSRDLAASYLRLHRAMNTDATLPPYDDEPEADVMTLGELRQDFADLAELDLEPVRDDRVEVLIEDDYTWPEDPEESQEAAARTSLIVTGPVRAEQRFTAAEQAANEGRLDDAGFLEELDALMRDAGATATAAADREVLRGGRQLLHDATEADPKVIGWARVTDDDPCAWCAMLASRGAVYRTREAATTRRIRQGELPPVSYADLARYHDQCHCEALPLYSRTDWLPEQGRTFRELWDESTRGHSGRDAINAYRRAIEARRRRARARRVALT